MARDVVTKEYMNSASSSTNSGAARTGLATIAGLVATQVQAAITELVSALAGKANTSHVHSGADITTGTLAAARNSAPTSIDGVSNAGGDIDLVAGSNVTITPDDTANTITIAAAGGGGSAPIVQRNDITVSSGASTLDFASPFAVTESPAGEANIAPTFGTAAATFAQGDDARFTKYLPLTFFYSGDVSTKTGVGHYIAMVAGTLDVIRVAADSAPAGGTVTITFVKEAGGPGGSATTIGSITLAIASKSGSTTGLSVSLAAGDTVRMDVTTNAGYTAASCKNLTGSARYSY